TAPPERGCGAHEGTVARGISAPALLHSPARRRSMPDEKDKDSPAGAPVPGAGPTAPKAAAPSPAGPAAPAAPAAAAAPRPASQAGPASPAPKPAPGEVDLPRRAFLTTLGFAWTAFAA